MSIYQDLSKVKNKYAQDILTVDGIHAVGIRVLEKKIIVYAHDLSPSILCTLPFEFEGYTVEVRAQVEPEIRMTSGYEDFSKKSANEIAVSNDFWMRSTLPTFPSHSMIHMGVSSATLGSFLWSYKYDCPVIVSNNHVLARASSDGDINARNRQSSNSVEFLVDVGGTAYNGAQLNDYVRSDFMFSLGTPTITSVSKWKAKTGDLITIYGNNLGFRMGYSKVFFGGKEAIVKSWQSKNTGTVKTFTSWFKDTSGKKDNVVWYTSLSSDSVIEVYVPAGLDGQRVDLRVECEGDPIVSSGPMDAWQLDHIGDPSSVLNLQIAELLDFLPLRNGAGRDVAIAKPTRSLDNYFYEHIRHSTNPYVDSPKGLGQKTYSKTGQTYHPQGIRTELCEKIPVIKTGRTTGTTLSIIFDPDMSTSLDYGGNGFVFDTDAKNPIVQNWCIAVRNIYTNQKQTNPDGSQTLLPLSFLEGGDSGSTLMTADYQDYLDYMAEYQAYHADGEYQGYTVNNLPEANKYVLTQADLDIVEQTVGKIDPYCILGNMFASSSYVEGYFQDYSAYGDKVENWFNDLSLGVTPPIEFEPVSVQSTNTLIANVGFSDDFFINMRSTSRVDIQVNYTFIINNVEPVKIDSKSTVGAQIDYTYLVLEPVNMDSRSGVYTYVISFTVLPLEDFALMPSNNYDAANPLNFSVSLYGNEYNFVAQNTVQVQSWITNFKADIQQYLIPNNNFILVPFNPPTTDQVDFIMQRDGLFLYGGQITSIVNPAVSIKYVGIGIREYENIQLSIARNTEIALEIGSKQLDQTFEISSKNVDVIFSV